MKLPDFFTRPQPTQLDLRWLGAGAGAGLILCLAWLLFASDSKEPEFELQPVYSDEAGTARMRQGDNNAKGVLPERKHENKAGDKQEKKRSVTVRDPFNPSRSRSADAPQRPRQNASGLPAAGRTRQETRLAGVVESGGARQVLIDRGGYDVTLTEGESRDGLTVLEVGEDYVIVNENGDEKELRLKNAPEGGGGDRARRSETAAGGRRSGGNDGDRSAGRTGRSGYSVGTRR